MTDRTAITLTALRYLAALADSGHFGRAAAACGVSQSALSEQIAKLEKVLGAALVERSRGARLTAAGRLAVEHARTMLREADAIADEVGASREPLSGAFRLGVIPTLAPHLLPALLPALRAARPQLRLAVHEALTSSILADVAAHRLDAGLVALPVSMPGLVTRPLFEEPFLAVLPAGHALAARASVSASDLAGDRVLLLAEGHCLREQQLELCAASSGRAPSDAGDDFSATSLETLLRLVEAGFGVTFVPAPAAPRGPGVVARPLVRPGTGAKSGVVRTLGLVWRKSHARPGDLVALGALVLGNLPPGAQARRRPSR